MFAAAAAVDHSVSSYRRLHIYTTKARLYVIGYDEFTGRYRILKLRRQDGAQLDALEDTDDYDAEECNRILAAIHENSGGLQLVCKGHGIIGCFRFTDSYYLLVITQREYLGHICGHKVYRIADTALVPLGLSTDSASAGSATERRYRKLLLGVDLTKNFFFSYSYSLAHTLQHNHTQVGRAAAAAAGAGGQPCAHHSSGAAGAGLHHPAAGPSAASGGGTGAPGWEVYDSSMFVWNAHLTRPLRQATGNPRWTLPLVHGFWEQRQVSVLGRQLTLTLVARRSRHFAGTRFRKRGISHQGFVANEVETEQIVDAGVDWSTGQPLWSSMVQLRGSIPLFWSQQTSSLSPKPDILLQQFDPLYKVTEVHFNDLKRRYGNPIVALNLLKSVERRPREVLLRKEYGVAVSLINELLPPEEQLCYVAWDFQKHAKQPGSNILLEMAPLLNMALDLTGLYIHSPASCPICQPAICRRLQARQTGAAGMPSKYIPSAAQVTSTSAAVAAAVAAQAVPAGEQTCCPVFGDRQQQFDTAAETEGAESSGQQPPPPAPHTCQPPASTPGAAAGAAHHQHPRAWRPPAPKPRATAPTTQLQQGLLRTNCIDCLDRTNVVQFAYGLAALGRQLQQLGLSEAGELDSDSSLAFQLMEVYEAMGHQLAQQYGGSEAHAAFFQKKRGEWDATTQSRDLVTSIRRFYSNAYTDAEKQDAINLFLGNYVPAPGLPALWELDTDYYLHCSLLNGHNLDLRQDVSPASSTSAAAAPQRLPILRTMSPAVPLRHRRPPSSRVAALDLSKGPPQLPAPPSMATAAAAAAPSASRASTDAASDGANGSAAGWEPAAVGHCGAAVQASGGVVANDAGAAAGSADGSGGAQQQSMRSLASPFASAAACAIVASVGTVAAPGAGGDVGSPLLPLTQSDGITCSSSTNWEAAGQQPADTGWDFKAVFAQLVANQSNIQLTPAAPEGAQLVCFDLVLAKVPPVRPVRLYRSSGGGRSTSLMWTAVQQAFAFFQTSEGAVGSSMALLEAGSADYSPTPGTPQQQAPSQAQAPSSPSTPASSQGPSRHGSIAATTTSTPPSGPAHVVRAAAAAAAAQLGGVLSPSGGRDPSSPGLLSGWMAAAAPKFPVPSSSGIAPLNDILEIRTDIRPVRLISAPDKPPMAFGPQPAPPATAGQWLDTTLDQLMWGSVGQQQQRRRCTAISSHPAGGAAPLGALHDILEVRPAADQQQQQQLAGQQLAQKAAQMDQQPADLSAVRGWVLQQRQRQLGQLEEQQGGAGQASSQSVGVTARTAAAAAAAAAPGSSAAGICAAALESPRITQHGPAATCAAAGSNNSPNSNHNQNGDSGSGSSSTPGGVGSSWPWHQGLLDLSYLEQQQEAHQQAWLQLLHSLQGAPGSTGGDGDRDSIPEAWQPSPAVVQPSLAAWAEQGLQDLGLSPDLLELWLGLTGCGVGCWEWAQSLAHSGCRAQERSFRGLLDAGCCQQLYLLYEARQLRPPVQRYAC